MKMTFEVSAILTLPSQGVFSGSAPRHFPRRSSAAAGYVSSDATAKTVTIRVPRPLQTTGFYRICVVND